MRIAIAAATLIIRAGTQINAPQGGGGVFLENILVSKIYENIRHSFVYELVNICVYEIYAYSQISPNN